MAAFRASHLRPVLFVHAPALSTAPCVQNIVAQPVRSDDKLEFRVSMKFPTLAFAASCLAASCVTASPAGAWAPTATAEQELKVGHPFSQVDPAPDGAVLIH